MKITCGIKRWKKTNDEIIQDGSCKSVRRSCCSKIPLKIAAAFFIRKFFTLSTRLSVEQIENFVRTHVRGCVNQFKLLPKFFSSSCSLALLSPLPTSPCRASYNSNVLSHDGRIILFARKSHKFLARSMVALNFWVALWLLHC